MNLKELRKVLLEARFDVKDIVRKYGITTNNPNRQIGQPKSKKFDKKDSREKEAADAKNSRFPEIYRYPPRINGRADATSIQFNADSNHPRARAFQRRPEFTERDWQELHRKVYDKIKSENLKSGLYLFYSKSMQQGYICRYTFGKVRVITVLPKGKHDPRGGWDAQGNPPKETTSLVMMESLEMRLYGILIEAGQYTYIEMD